MEITDEVERNNNRIIERRILKLFEVPLNISTKFRCSGVGYSKMISFRVKGERIEQTNFYNNESYLND